VTALRTAAHSGWLELSGPGLVAVVAAADRHRGALAAAAERGGTALIEELGRHGVSQMPEFVVLVRSDDVVRVIIRGGGSAVLADGTRLEAGGRQPWSDRDIPGDRVGEYVMARAAARTPRGWRRPGRIERPITGARGHPEELTLPPPEESTGAPPAERVSSAPPAAGGIIASVPWRRPGSAGTDRSDAVLSAGPESVGPSAVVGRAEPRAAADDVPEATLDPRPAGTAPTGTDTLDEPPSAPVAGPAELTTDRGSLPRVDDDLDRPVVLAVRCPAGHLSAPHLGTCRSCGRVIPPQQPFPTPRPPLGILHISTGGVVPLDRGVLVGRAPRVNEELPASDRPHLLRVGGPERDISRNHVEIIIEGWHVLVRDLGSTNGTTVTLPGQEPVRVRPADDHGIEPGAVVTLADEVSLTYEVEE
jgi:hypothetical protein